MALGAIMVFVVAIIETVGGSSQADRCTYRICKLIQVILVMEGGGVIKNRYVGPEEMEKNHE